MVVRNARTRGIRAEPDSGAHRSEPVCYDPPRQARTLGTTLEGEALPASQQGFRTRTPSRIVALGIVFGLIVVPSLVAHAAAWTFTPVTGCTVQGQNGSGINTPWSKTSKKSAGCIQTLASLQYWNGTQYVWKYSGWQNTPSINDYAYTSVSGVSTYNASEHGGKSPTNNLCGILTKTGSRTYPVFCSS